MPSRVVADSAFSDELKHEWATLVVLEATGNCWKPFYYLLGDAGLNVMLVNPRQVRQVPGRQTDVNDVTWLADLGTHGLVHGSFAPPVEIRELKELVGTTLIWCEAKKLNGWRSF